MSKSYLNIYKIIPLGADDNAPLEEVDLMQNAPQQVAPPPGEARGYIRLAGMDGKTIVHRVS